MEETMGQRITRLREGQSISLSELARRVGKSKGHMYSIESGLTKEIGVSLAYSISCQLFITMEMLIGMGDIERERELARPVLENTLAILNEATERVKSVLEGSDDE